MCHKVVGAIDGMDIDDDGDANTNSNTEDAKTNAVESDREKGKRKVFVGSQALNFRRDLMEVSLLSWTKCLNFKLVIYFQLSPRVDISASLDTVTHKRWHCS